MADQSVTDGTLTDKTAPVLLDRLLLVNSEANPDSLTEMELTNLLKIVTLHTEDTTPVIADEIVTYDASATAPKKVALSNLLKIINGLTEDTAPQTDDYVATYDASASGPKKVALSFLANYTLQMACAAFNPADATTYFFAARFSVVASTSSANMRVYVPRTGAVKAVYVNFKGTAGTSEQSTVSLRKNDTTDTTVVSNLDLSTLPAFVSNTALNVAVATGDFLNIKWVTPTWVTNPTSIDIDALIYIG